MQCSITYSGNLNLVIEWYKNGVLLPSLSNIEKQDSNKVLLSIVTIQRNDSVFTTYVSVTFFKPIKEHPSYANNVLNYRFKWQVTAGVKSSGENFSIFLIIYSVCFIHDFECDNVTPMIS